MFSFFYNSICILDLPALFYFHINVPALVVPFSTLSTRPFVPSKEVHVPLFEVISRLGTLGKFDEQIAKLLSRLNQQYFHFDCGLVMISYPHFLQKNWAEF